MASDIVERFRAEVRRRRFRRMDDAELAQVRQRSQNAHASNVIEGIVPDPETAALFDVLLEERIPAGEWPDLVLGFMRRHRSGKAVARNVG